ncbi:hypothetical protein BZA77DRAFT_369374, partial [Pyronema omphalodes]
PRPSTASSRLFISKEIRVLIQSASVFNPLQSAMSDTLSIAASIAGLMTFSKEVITIVANYVSGVNSVLENVRCLQNELTTLHSGLDGMRNLLREEELLRTSFDQTSVLISAVDVASFQIKDLYTKLDKFRIPKNNRAAEFVERMKWPLRADECEKAVVQIQRLAQCLHFSLNISNRSFLGKTHSVVLAELEKNHNELQTGTMSTLQKISLAVPEQLSQQSEELSKMVSIMTEISTSSVEINKISTGVHELQTLTMTSIKLGGAPYRRRNEFGKNVIIPACQTFNQRLTPPALGSENRIIWSLLFAYLALFGTEDFTEIERTAVLLWVHNQDEW